MAHQKTAISRLAEVVEGPMEVADTIGMLGAKATQEVCSFILGTSPKARLRQAQKQNSEMYERGIRSRAIYLTEVREHEATLEYVNWVNEQGSEVRTLPNLPMQMIILDAKTAVLPFKAKSGQQAIVIHRDPSVVYCLQVLFEEKWTTASPLGQTFDRNGVQISFEDRAVLEMLSLGRVDREICADVGVSERTLATRIGRMMTRLEAKTRFAAGVAAAKRNWI